MEDRNKCDENNFKERRYWSTSNSILNKKILSITRANVDKQKLAKFNLRGC